MLEYGTELPISPRANTLSELNSGTSTNQQNLSDKGQVLLEIKAVRTLVFSS
jgi:hypothetical protein